jgi:hypothetical protein
MREAKIAMALAFAELEEEAIYQPSEPILRSVSAPWRPR